jgi:hypothetical protein
MDMSEHFDTASPVSAVPKRPLKVFLCHAHADRDPVRGLYARLTQDGVDAWLDKEKLLPGQDWELEIRKAVREADVVVVCLSKQFNQAGFRQKEVRLALDTAMEKPEGEIFIIPARLEECDNLESLRKWHWVDLFEDDGYEMLMRALRARADKIGVVLTSNIESKNKILFTVKKRSLKILVTGGRDTSETVEALASFIGYQVALRGHVLLNNGTRGVDKASAEGAFRACDDYGYDSQKIIQVFRPTEGLIPDFDYGTLNVVRQTYNQRRDFVVNQADAVIVLGGEHGTRGVADFALSIEKPLIPIPVGDPNEAAVEIWQEMIEESQQGKSEIGLDDLGKLSHPRYTFEQIAINAVILAENITYR